MFIHDPCAAIAGASSQGSFMLDHQPGQQRLAKIIISVGLSPVAYLEVRFQHVFYKSPMRFSSSAHGQSAKSNFSIHVTHVAPHASIDRSPANDHPSDRHVVGQSGDSRRVVRVALLLQSPSRRSRTLIITGGPKKPNV